jgi:transcriptional regulator with XRE-family HTH domain
LIVQNRLSADDNAVHAQAAKAVFADRLKAAIARKGWTLGQTAHQASRFLDNDAKFGRASVWQYLQGRVLPRPQHLEALSRALGVGHDELIPPALLSQAKKRSRRARTAFGGPEATKHAGG